MNETPVPEPVLYEQRDSIAWITLNRPAAMNAINMEMRRLFPQAVARAEADPEIRALVIRGAGERAFCVGADVKEFRTPESVVQSRQFYAHNHWVAPLANARKPVLAAIHGFCLGGGLEIALACDLRIAAEDTQLGLPEVSVGTLPGAGGTQRLSRVVGLGHALHLILTGERIGAQEAYRIGLITRVVPRDQLLAEVERLAGVLSSRAPIAVLLAKEAVRKGYELPLEDGLRLEADLLALVSTTEDRAEAGAAFREKRKPVFKGR